MTVYYLYKQIIDKKHMVRKTMIFSEFKAILYNNFQYIYCLVNS
jgi:hypothetical protein